MRIVPKRIINNLAVFLLLTNTLFAAPTPPPPSTPPPPPGLPLDGGLAVLLIISLLFGIYKIYKHQLIKKASN